MVKEISKDPQYQVIVFDNLSKGDSFNQGHKESVPPTAAFEQGDIRNVDDLDRVFTKYHPEAVFVTRIHVAFLRLD